MLQYVPFRISSIDCTDLVGARVSIAPSCPSERGSGSVTQSGAGYDVRRRVLFAGHSRAGKERIASERHRQEQRSYVERAIARAVTQV